MNKKLLLSIFLITFNSQIFGIIGTYWVARTIHKQQVHQSKQDLNNFKTPFVEGGCYHYNDKESLDKKWKNFIKSILNYLGNKKEEPKKPETNWEQDSSLFERD